MKNYRLSYLRRVKVVMQLDCWLDGATGGRASSYGRTSVNGRARRAGASTGEVWRDPPAAKWSLNNWCNRPSGRARPLGATPVRIWHGQVVGNGSLSSWRDRPLLVAPGPSVCLLWPSGVATTLEKAP